MHYNYQYESKLKWYKKVEINNCFSTYHSLLQCLAWPWSEFAVCLLLASSIHPVWFEHDGWQSPALWPASLAVFHMKNETVGATQYLFVVIVTNS